jgi:hypothetical protein
MAQTFLCFEAFKRFKIRRNVDTVFLRIRMDMIDRKLWEKFEIVDTALAH